MGLARTGLVCYAVLPDGHGFERTIAAAADAGFDEVSLWLMSIEQARGELGSLEAVADCLAAHGMRASVLELLLAWPRGDAAVCAEETSVMQAAVDVFQPDVILSACMDPQIASGGVELFKAQCQALAPCKIALEFLPWSALPTLDSAFRLLESIDEDNLGLVLDGWHFARAGQEFEVLERIPGERIHFVQLCDAAAESGRDVFEETLGGRLRPGEGVVNWPRLMEILSSKSLQCPIGTEQYSWPVKAMALDEACRYLYASVQDIVADPTSRPC